MRVLTSFAVASAFLTALSTTLAGAAPPQTSQVPVRPGPGITSPKLIKQVEPSYPSGVLEAQIHGTVEIEAAVGVDGIPTVMRVTRPLSPAFDAAAVIAAKQWRFEPGLDATGRPVPAIVMLIVEFKPPSATEDPEFATAFRPGSGISNPVLVRQVGPKYTPEAMQANIEGVVELDVVVRADGTVGAVKVVKSLDQRYGLDAEAIKAAKLWLFKPGSDRLGVAVPVRVRLILEFRY